tara:strand:- start:138 stop:896 length:759 start_codon:yes stop_codon:yes gene_type:complete
MLPYKDDNPQLIIPYTTYTIIALNLIAWLFFQGAGASENVNAAVCSYGAIPAEVVGSVGEKQICENNVGALALLTSMFLHGSWMHILGNMLFLWVFGGNVEDAMGPARFAIFYLLTGLSAALAQVFWDTNSSIPMVGASGAIGGVMGAYLLLYPKVKVHIFAFFILAFPIRVPAYLMLGYWFLLQLIEGLGANSMTGGTAFWAHAGGFIAGTFFGYLLKDEELLTGHVYYGWNQRAAPESVWDDQQNRHHND